MSQHNYYPDIYIPRRLEKIKSTGRRPNLPPIFYVNLVALTGGCIAFAFTNLTMPAIVLAITACIFAGLKLTNYAQERKEYQRLQRKLSEIRRQRILEQLKSTRPHDLIKRATRGQSEDYFYKYLKNNFPKKVFRDYAIEIPNFDYPYTTDFTYYDSELGLRIDIEIDEPYFLDDKINQYKPYHYLNSDKEKNRNHLFLEYGWLVIRFAEEQVYLYPDSCCKEIAKTIAQLLETNLDPKWGNIADIRKIKRWTEAESKQMIKTQHRQKYLPASQNFPKK